MVDMAGEVVICNRKGEIETYLVPIAYCVSCGIYYMLEETFVGLKRLSKKWSTKGNNYAIFC